MCIARKNCPHLKTDVTYKLERRRKYVAPASAVGWRRMQVRRRYKEDWIRKSLRRCNREAWPKVEGPTPWSDLRRRTAWVGAATRRMSTFCDHLFESQWLDRSLDILWPSLYAPRGDWGSPQACQVKISNDQPFAKRWSGQLPWNIGTYLVSPVGGGSLNSPSKFSCLRLTVQNIVITSFSWNFRADQLWFQAGYQPTKFQLPTTVYFKVDD